MENPCSIPRVQFSDAKSIGVIMLTRKYNNNSNNNNNKGDTSNNRGDWDYFKVI